MNKREIFDASKIGFQRFCTNTSCHGFHELYHAKTLFWRVFWIVICGGALGITVHQVIECIDQYINNESGTVVLAADEDSIFYPPLKLCYWHWLYWVDFQKAMATKIDRGALLFSFNFYTRIFSNIPYDVDEVETKLFDFLKSHNFSSVFEFHKSIARPVPIVNVGRDNISLYFTSAEVMFRDPGFLYCYTIPNEQMFRYFDEHKSDLGEVVRKIVAFSILTENYEFNGNHISDFIRPKEYNHYMLRWITHKTKYRINDTQRKKNYTQFAPPVLLFPNAFDQKNDIAVVSDADHYKMNLKGSASKWLNSLKRVCSVGERSLADNESCQFDCTVKVYKQNCSCIRYHFAIHKKADTPDNVCRDEFYLLPASGEPYLAPLKTPNKTVTSQICYFDKKSNDSYRTCLGQCRKPCETWAYDISVVVTTMPSFVSTIGDKSVTDVIIEYPTGSNIQIMVETEPDSWESFVGNVGGLLGIWTGASIVSFIQLIYLCCCADVGDCDYNYHMMWLLKKFKNGIGNVKMPNIMNNINQAPIVAILPMERKISAKSMASLDTAQMANLDTPQMANLDTPQMVKLDTH